MSFDTEINQLMAQIDALKKENELLRASPPGQGLSEPVGVVVEKEAPSYSAPNEMGLGDKGGVWYSSNKTIEWIKYFRHTGAYQNSFTDLSAGDKLYTHAPASPQPSQELSKPGSCFHFGNNSNSQAIEKLEAEKAELLQVLKDTANKIYSNSTIDELIAIMESKP